jgi:glycosyltransferase involved in cell wall biosynthesis
LAKQKRNAAPKGDSRYRERLQPVPHGVERPLWSVMIPTFNCAGYLRETLGSVLAQDPGPHLMQIEVIDDASDRDDPQAVVAELGQGRVGFYRQPANVGHAANFRTCLERARGHYVHLLHGDDAVKPGFYSRIHHGFERCPDAGAAFCRQIYVDSQGREIWISDVERSPSGPLDNWLERISVRQLIQTPSIVVRRTVYERLGLFDPRLSWCEDWEMWCRIAANYPVWYEEEPLALYRLHDTSSTSRKIHTGENVRDVRRAAKIISAYLPPASAPRIHRESMEHWADDALRVRAPMLLQHGDLVGAGRQIIEALRCSRSPATIRKLAGLLARSSSRAAKAMGARSAALFRSS